MSRNPSHPRGSQSPAVGSSSRGGASRRNASQPRGSQSPAVGSPSREGAPARVIDRPPAWHYNSTLNTNGMSLGPSQSWDPTSHHYVHQTAPGTYGAGDPLPPLHYDYMGVRGPNPQFPQDRLPSIRDVENGTHPGLLPMSQLILLPNIEARTQFIQARELDFPDETEAEHDEVFQRRWDQELEAAARAAEATAQATRAAHAAGRAQGCFRAHASRGTRRPASRR
ncbi:MAG: hypothetical protein LQ345_006938 [Seirophora villosa]|nr:MAG: hypothetical protein LQ345_006938 [Seirophora villosa]